MKKHFTAEDLITAGVNFSSNEGAGFGFTTFEFVDYFEKVDPQPEWMEGTKAVICKTYPIHIYSSSSFGMCQFYTSTDELTQMFSDELEGLGEIQFEDHQIRNSTAIVYRLLSYYILNKYNEHLATFHLSAHEDLFYAIDFEVLRTQNKGLYQKLLKFSNKYDISLQTFELRFEEEDGEHFYEFVNPEYLSEHRYFLSEVIHNLPPHLKASVTYLFKELGSITLAYGLVMGYFSDEETLLLNDLMYHQFDPARINEAELPKEAFGEVTNKMRRFVEVMEREQLLQLISVGENKHVEFKSTLRFNIRSGNVDKGIEHECLKSIAAFVNTDGGTLIIGVEDNGTILGLNADGFDNSDKFLLHLRNLIVQKLVPTPFNAIDYEVISISNKEICRVKCSKSATPVYIKDQQNEEFYIRTGPSSKKLQPSELVKYINQRFKST